MAPNRAAQPIGALCLRLDGHALVLDLADGGTRRLVVRPGEAAFSNQRAFARDVARYLDDRSGEAVG